MRPKTILMSHNSPSMKQVYERDLQARDEWVKKQMATGDPDLMERVALNPDKEYVASVPTRVYEKKVGAMTAHLLGKATAAGWTSTATHEDSPYGRSIKTTPDSPFFFDRILRAWCRFNKVHYKDAMKAIGNIGRLSPVEVVDLLEDLEGAKATLKGRRVPLPAFNVEQVKAFKERVRAGQYNRQQIKAGDRAASAKMERQANKAHRATHQQAVTRARRAATAAWEKATGQRW